MKALRIDIILIWLVGIFISSNVSAQSQFATIKKNENLAAQSLQHDLNETKDTLKLVSSNYIHRIYTVGDSSRMVDIVVNRRKYDLSLRELVKGKHIFVVQESGKKIIFQVHINQDSWQDISKRVGETILKPDSKTISAEKSDLMKSTVTVPESDQNKME